MLKYSKVAKELGLPNPNSLTSSYLIKMGCMDLKITVRDLAKITKIDETDLSKIVNNKKVLSFNLAERVAAALDLDPLYLMNPSRKPRPELKKISHYS